MKGVVPIAMQRTGRTGGGLGGSPHFLGGQAGAAVLEVGIELVREHSRLRTATIDEPARLT